MTEVGRRVLIETDTGLRIVGTIVESDGDTATIWPDQPEWRAPHMPAVLGLFWQPDLPE